MRKTDISQYAGGQSVGKKDVSTAKSVFKMILRGIATVLAVLAVSGTIVSVSLFSYIYGLKNESVDYDLHKLQLNYTSFIYVNGSGDDASNPVKYQSLYSSENRIWVDYDKIPKAMKDAIVAIEDKRYWEHKGVDWKRTFSAVVNLFNFFQSDGSSYGGSTITQQLIKNVTGENEVSLTRKVKEIFRAMNLEKKYSKEEILGAYLNVVPFGSGCNGVQTAANLYFGKNIQDCDIAQCAAIAGITQNPTAYSPLTHPDKNRERQQTVLTAMHDQKKITDDEYQAAMKESENMKFVGKKTEDVVDENSVWNWYTEAMFEDVKTSLMETYSCSSDKAVDMIYHGGLKIYSAMDSDLQSIAEGVFNGSKAFPAAYPNLQGGYVAMDYSGRVLSVVGARGKKESNRLFNMATDAKRQPGSSIKPLAVYGPAINAGLINYSSLVNDEPVPNWKDGKSGPANWDNKYHGIITVEKALEQSYNAASVQVDKLLTPNISFNFLREKLGFTSLEPADNTLAAMAVGGMTQGITVEEMTAGFQMFGNGGKYYKPYTFYYIEDHDGNVIVDNRDEVPTQAISSVASTIVHKLLNNVMQHGTGITANISGWDVFGKTGTTNDNKDSWFVGGTSYAVAGVWTGYRTPKVLNSKYETPVAKAVWKAIMTQYLKDREKKSFDLDQNVIPYKFCVESGLLANPGVCTETKTGWYDKNNLPAICSLDHGTAGSEPESSSSGTASPGSSGGNSQWESSAPESGDVSSKASESHPRKNTSKPENQQWRQDSITPGG
ncbi:transglycosylase [Caproiciproducens sp. NJN-50]|uniref:transglycosylase domain-containing protein n=1 Tax=Acutalibacteraceae TaxID=3082771 RepID=UPI000FFE0FD7|nr:MULTISPECIES: transglycosylase domain-containing protein [Acutalibacteraceae]QAT49292.1 transglycosylase [Caproiciproducens sp. NJN-50]